MAKFLKHIGKHGDRKIAVVFREVPNEPHMCLVTYTELLNRNIHDPFIQCIESDIGQASESLADALNRSYTSDGRPLLQVLHVEGLLKKVQTEQVVMTPMPGTNIKLDELNRILNEMKQGEEAVKKLSEMDKSRGLQDPTDVARRMREGNAAKNEAARAPVTPPPTGSALDDTALARQFVSQAAKMEREARGLLAESQRLMKEAQALDPTIAAPAPVTPQIVQQSTAVVEPAKKAGRPKKVKTAVV